MNDRRPWEAGCRWSDTAASFALATLSETEREAFAAHLLEGCGPCGAELAEARQATVALDLAVAEREERHALDEQTEGRLAALKQRLLAGAGGTPTTTVPASYVPSSIAGVALVPGSSEGWKASGFDGVAVKRLAVDPERRYATTLVRMAPGVVFPAHRHTGREECYVVSGDLRFGDDRLLAGDYQIAEAGSVHPEHSTEEGCLLLIVASESDELLPC